MLYGCLPISTFLYTMCMLVPAEVRRGTRFLETGVTGSYELPCGYWELNLCLLEEQLVFLTAEPFLVLRKLFNSWILYSASLHFSMWVLWTLCFYSLFLQVHAVLDGIRQCESWLYHLKSLPDLGQLLYGVSVLSFIKRPRVILYNKWVNLLKW